MTAVPLKPILTKWWLVVTQNPIQPEGHWMGHTFAVRPNSDRYRLFSRIIQLFSRWSLKHYYEYNHTFTCKLSLKITYTTKGTHNFGSLRCFTIRVLLMLVLDDDCNRTISIHSSILAGNDCATETLASTFSTHKKINNCVAAQFKRGMCFYVNACVCKCVCVCVFVPCALLCLYATTTKH